MNQYLNHFRENFSSRHFKLLRVLFLSLVALTVLTFFTVYQNESKTVSVLGFWESYQNSGSSEMNKAQNRQPLWKPEFLGEVNMHVFEDWCGGSVHQLRTNVLYPLFPHTRTTIGRLAVNAGWKNYGLRIFGYIHPVLSGEYIFAIASDNNAEFWLSSDESTKSIKLMAYLGKTGKEWAAPGEYEKFSSQISQPVLLSRNMKYFFEVLYKQNDGIDHLEVAWRLNNEDSNFEIITAEYLSRYVDESSLQLVESDHIPQTKASHTMSTDAIFKTDKSEVDMVKADPRDFIYRTPLLKESYLENVFLKCDYYPLHIFDNATIERYDGINYVHYSSVYPNDHTRLANEGTDTQLCFYQKDETYGERDGFGPYVKIENTGEEETEDNSKSSTAENKPKWKQVFSVKSLDFHSKQSDFVVHTCNRAGNIIMLKKEVMPVVEAFMSQLKTTETTSDLVIKRVLNVEKRTDNATVSRYMLELELEDKQGKNMLLSKYFYATKDKNKGRNPKVPTLCSPNGFSWNPEATVHVILAVKNQGRWVMHFIKEMEKVYKTTRDKNFNIILIDYNSTDIDVEKELKNANIPSYQFKRLDGPFGRSPGLQVGIDLVEDENSILFLCDLHLHFPVTIIDTVRKHCVQGKMVFAPVVMRLECGATVQSPRGFWETMGYGLIGIYKSDMVRIGGMNVKEFTDKWGGEDWELLDRILLNKLEVERLNLRNFLHFFHSKQGMWNTE
ncbi:beta-1,4-N-acetylgalactosaminyltransferase 3 [Ictalurus punctatus]|uniref:Beta-1,4-N-acetylgalactosaminyltransferase n=1 Tax=Ictalurus punctatus TaxID=7998 RepID=A0A2D0T679_ICTPU|nr:beta-1,4-N-acetylgalactosaminyltransferase 3 [Ictalurus punctatus]